MFCLLKYTFPFIFLQRHHFRYISYFLKKKWAKNYVLNFGANSDRCIPIYFQRLKCSDHPHADVRLRRTMDGAAHFGSRFRKKSYNPEPSSPQLSELTKDTIQTVKEGVILRGRSYLSSVFGREQTADPWSPKLKKHVWLHQVARVLVGWFIFSATLAATSKKLQRNFKGRTECSINTSNFSWGLLCISRMSKKAFSPKAINK